jgi:hypothetical protein
VGSGSKKGVPELGEMVAAAEAEYEFRRHRRSRALVRRSRQDPGRGVERLVDGLWLGAWTPRRFGDKSVWEPLKTAEKLRWHVRRYLIKDLAAPAIGRRPLRRWLDRSSVGRWIDPPLRGGARRRGITPVAERQRENDRERLGGAALVELEEQALLGYEHQRERVRSIEQRATFFLGAAGLTTSLVLANAGLLLGSGKLGDRWLTFGALALGFASLCTIAAGLRALQATMTTFTRLPPDNVPRLDERLAKQEEDLRRARIAALLVGQYRTSAIADWKVARLKAARSWFITAIAGIVVLTGIVLVNAAGDEESDSGKKAAASVTKVPVLGEHHRDAGGVAGLDHLAVAFGPAGLDHGVGAGLDRQLGAVGEGEEGVGGEGGAG